MSTQIFGVSFFPSTHHALQQLEGFADSYLCQAPDQNGMVRPGGIAEMKALNIPYQKYRTCLIFHPGRGPGQLYLLEQCLAHGIQVIENQHGYNKSVMDIADHTPNAYCRYWNCMGRYMLDLYKQTYGRSAATRSWIALGSLKHDALFRTHRWDKKQTNGKVLLLYEPDTDDCENDPVPLRATYLTARTITALQAAGVDFDLKLHPNWPNFVGNTGKPMWRPPEDVNTVNFGMQDMLRYEVVVGSWSSALIDAACMGMPVINLNYPDYPTKWHSVWVPGKIELFIKADPEQVPDVLEQAQKWRFDGEKLAYIVGPLGQTHKRFQAFIKNHLTL